MSFIHDYSSGLTGIFMASVENRRSRKALQAIQDVNEVNKGIIRYQPSQIEAFFEENTPLENMMFSGGANSIRIRAITRAIECAYVQGYSLMVLHCGDRNLEQNLNDYFGSGNLCFINNTNPLYDPFSGASNDEIVRLTISSSTKDSKINTVGRYYLKGVSDYIRANHKTPRCYMYINCPHLTFIDGVNKAESQGRISQDQSRAIISQIMQGEVERGNIETFFQSFYRQSAAILAQKSNAANAVNFSIASHRQKIFCVDVQTSINTLLINMLINEAYALMTLGPKVIIVIDGIQIISTDVLRDCLKRAGTNLSVVVSLDDVYSGFGGSDNDFFAFAGTCSKIVISKHSSAYSCQKFSDLIGSYDKQEINCSFAQNTNYVGRWGYGSTNTASINIKRENIVKPEKIQRMAGEEVFIKDKLTGELSYTTIL